MKFAILYNWLVFLYQAAFILLFLNDKLRFGHGLGDLYFLIAAAVVLLIHFLITLSCYRRQQKDGSVWSFFIYGSLFLLVAMLFTYKFTVGRGPEFSWNGQVLVDL